MSHRPIDIEELRDLIHEGKVADPLIFLESIMNGQDPRTQSQLYDLIIEIDDFTGGDITHGDWAEIVDMVSARYKYKNVSLGESVGASKTLAEYMHSKRKQIEIKDGSTGSAADPANHPLTEDEIAVFKEKFNDEF